MSIDMLDSAKHVDRHEPHSISHVSPTRPFAVYYGEIEIDQHTAEAVSCFRVCDDDIILWDISVEYFGIGK